MKVAVFSLETHAFLVAKVHSLKAVQSVIVNDKHSFELYGLGAHFRAECSPKSVA